MGKHNIIISKFKKHYNYNNLKKYILLDKNQDKKCVLCNKDLIYTNENILECEKCNINYYYNVKH